MAQYSFQEQLLSVMEIVAKAATDEIKRRVADSCALIRIELSRSQRDIDQLKKKCLLMESELRKVRGRSRRKVFICGPSQKIPFQSICAQKPGPSVRAAEPIGKLTQEDPKLSTRDAHQVLEDRANATIVKVEGTENEPWGSGGGSFTFDHHGNNSRSLAQETPVEPHQFTEDVEQTKAHFTHINSPVVTSNEQGPSGLRLQVKAEKEEEEEKEVQEVILVEGSEKRLEETDPSSQLSVFSQPVEMVIEQSRNDSSLTQAEQRELYNAGQITDHELPQPSWCRARTHKSNHMVQREAHDGSHQQHRTGVGPGMPSQTGALLGRGRGGHRRFRTQWITNVDGERRFSCSYCVRTFMRFGQLKEHLRSHTGERPYSCTQCGRSFTKQGNLIRHAVVHSGEKPYQCSLCGKCFTQRSSLKSHQKTHTERDGGRHGLVVHPSSRETHDSRAVTQSRGFGTATTLH